MITAPSDTEPGPDPQHCPDCMACGCICEYHRGWADGWDQAAKVVGHFVVLAGDASRAGVN